MDDRTAPSTRQKKMRWRKDGRLTSHLWGGSHKEYSSVQGRCQMIHNNWFSEAEIVFGYYVLGHQQPQLIGHGMDKRP